ncbi:MAG TPA: CDP-alcohol phosphatidyltransferase family protein [Candidatus Acidoferrales bacterium]|nr:CDP-alcohol phosphatidyltransferase family protein [Candidatus Acidoferrales bacterium]
MLRSYQLADLFTMGNAAAGTGAILAMMSYLLTFEPWRVYLALFLVPLALVLDIADGAIARSRREHSLFGRELDSLADIVSFGLAPAAIGYGLGMRGAVDVAILIFFAACGISRLARYNITASRLADASGKVRYYEGAPIPSSLVLVLFLGLCFYAGRAGENLPLGRVDFGGLQWHPLSLLYFANGCAMISKTLRVPKL